MVVVVDMVVLTQPAKPTALVWVQLKMAMALMGANGTHGNGAQTMPA